MDVLYRSNAIVSPYWRRLNMSETFLVGQTPKTKTKKQGPVSHEIYNDKNYGLRCERMHIFCTTSLIMVTSPFEWPIIELANSKWWNVFFLILKIHYWTFWEINFIHLLVNFICNVLYFHVSPFTVITACLVTY